MTSDYQNALDRIARSPLRHISNPSKVGLEDQPSNDTTRISTAVPSISTEIIENEPTARLV